MKILFVLGKYPDDGGVAKVTDVLFGGLQDRGHDVSIASFVNGKACRDKGTLLELEYPIGCKENVQRLNAYVKNKGIDIIICQWAIDFRVSRLCRKAIKDTSCKLVSVLHTAPGRTRAIQQSLDRLSGGLPILRRMVETGKLWVHRLIAKKSLQLTLNYSDFLLALSPSLLKEVQSFLGRNSEHRMGYIYNPITISHHEHVGFENKSNIVLFVGRLDNGTKKVMRTLQVWESFWQSNLNWQFCIVGDGPDKKELENYVTDNKISHVEFAGFVNPENYYKKAKILLLTSSYEGFPLVLGEAMANGVVPVVLESFVSAKDIIHNEEDGIVVGMPFNVNRFTSALSTIMMDESKLELYSKNAQERAMEFQLPYVLDEWESLFLKLYKS